MRKFFISIGLLIAAVVDFQAPAEAQVGVPTRVDLQSDPNYRLHNGQWWYAVSNRQWLMWNGHAWIGAGAGNRYAGPNGRYYYAPNFQGAATATRSVKVGARVGGAIGH